MARNSAPVQRVHRIQEDHYAWHRAVEPGKFRTNQAVMVKMWGGSPPPLIRHGRTSGKPKKAAIA